MQMRKVAVAVARSFGETLNKQVSSYMARTGLTLYAMPYVVDDLEAIPEAMRAEYEPKDGKFRLKLEGVDPDAQARRIHELNNENATRRNEFKDLTKRFEGVDPDWARDMASRIANDEELKLRAEGKHDEANKRLTARMQEDHKKELDKKDVEVKAEREKTQKYWSRVLDNELRAAAIKAGVHAAAIDDALLRGARIFTLDDAGNAVQLDETKKVVIGKDGKNPFSPTEWFEGMKETAPHWFPAVSAGGGANGTNGAAKGSGGPDWSGLSPVERMTRAREAQARK